MNLIQACLGVQEYNHTRTQDFPDTAEHDAQAEAARRMGMSLNRLNEIVAGKRGVTAETALLFAALTDTTPQLWMHLQADHDLWHALRSVDVKEDRGHADAQPRRGESCRCAVAGSGRRPKFVVGDAARANSKSPADYLGRSGLVTEIGTGKSEYRAEFEDGRQPTTGHLMSWWLDRVR